MFLLAYWRKIEEKYVLLYENNYLVNLDNFYEEESFEEKKTCDEVFKARKQPKTFKMDEGLIGISLKPELLLKKIVLRTFYVELKNIVYTNSLNTAILCEKILRRSIKELLENNSINWSSFYLFLLFSI